MGQEADPRGGAFVSWTRLAGSEDTAVDRGTRLGAGRRAGGVSVYGPWSWMNRQARRWWTRSWMRSTPRTAEASVPLVCTGGSMGGGSSLLYTRYAKRPVAACLAVVPVCDAAYHFDEREDLPRTFHQAFLGYKGSLAALLAEHSPLAQVKRMPRIPYRLVSGDADTAVSAKHHADPMVAAMRKRKLLVEYVKVPKDGARRPDAGGGAAEECRFCRRRIRARNFSKATRSTLAAAGGRGSHLKTKGKPMPAIQLKPLDQVETFTLENRDVPIAVEKKTGWIRSLLFQGEEDRPFPAASPGDSRLRWRA